MFAVVLKSLCPSHSYLPMGFTQFKIEGRGLGSALILEFLG